MRDREPVPSCTGNKGDDTCRQSVTVTCWQPVFRGGNWARSTTASALKPAEYHARKKQQSQDATDENTTCCDSPLTSLSHERTEAKQEDEPHTRSDMGIQNKVKTSFLGI